MKFIYIDNVNSLNEIRIAEKTIWTKEIPNMGHEVRFLLLGSNTLGGKISDQKFDSYRSSSVLKTLFFFTTKLRRSVKEFKPDYIVVRNKADIGFISFLISKLYPTRLIYIKAFPLLEFKVRHSKGIRRFLNNVLLHLEIVVCKNTDKLIIRTNSFADLLKKKYKIRRDACIIPMGIDGELISNIDQKSNNLVEFNNKYKTGIYFGALGETRDIGFILDTLERLKYKNKLLNFIIAGGTEDQINKLKKECDKNGLKIVFIPEMDRAELFKLIQKCDFSLSAIPPVEEYVISSPTKVIESLALGCPVIVNKEIVDQNDIISMSKGGIAVDYNIDQFCDAISDFIDDRYDLEIMRTNGREFVFKNRQYSNMAATIIEYIR